MQKSDDPQPAKQLLMDTESAVGGDFKVANQSRTTMVSDKAAIATSQAIATTSSSISSQQANLHEQISMESHPLYLMCQEKFTRVIELLEEIKSDQESNLATIKQQLERIERHLIPANSNFSQVNNFYIFFLTFQ